MKNWNRVLALLLAVMLCVSLLPVGVLADKEEIVAVEEEYIDLSAGESSVEGGTTEEVMAEEAFSAAEETAQEEKTAAGNLTEAEVAADELAVDGASSGACGDDLTWTLSDDGVLTISGAGDMFSFEHIAEPWLDSNMTAVIISEGVTGIGDYSFENCSSLEKVSIPDSVTYIGESAFFDCSALKSVTVPSSVTDIGYYAFGYYSIPNTSGTPGPGSVELVDGFNMVVASDSAAEAYAIDNGISYTLLGSEDTDAVEISEANFPDEVFRAYVSDHFDLDNSGTLSGTEIDAATEITISSENVFTLQGIEFFTELKKLECYDNQLTELDVTRNFALEYINCCNNSLTNLDFSKNTALVKIQCQKNNLTELEISRCSNLEILECFNNQLTELDVSGCEALRRLHCSDANLVSLNVSGNAVLREIYCQNNNLMSLDVSGCTALEILDCFNNNLTYLDVSANKKLYEIFCDNNNLVSLDVSSNTALTTLYCGGCGLVELDVTKNASLTDLRCDDNDFTSIDVSQNEALEILMCDGDQLENLDVSKNAALLWLYCNNCGLTELDVSKNASLTELSCQNNDFANLDVSHNTALALLWCENNNLTSLDVSKNSALENLNCRYNDLTELNISGCPILVELVTANEPQKETDPGGREYTSYGYQLSFDEDVDLIYSATPSNTYIFPETELSLESKAKNVIEVQVEGDETVPDLYARVTTSYKLKDGNIIAFLSLYEVKNNTISFVNPNTPTGAEILSIGVALVADADNALSAAYSPLALKIQGESAAETGYQYDAETGCIVGGYPSSKLVETYVNGNISGMSALCMAAKVGETYKIEVYENGTLVQFTTLVVPEAAETGERIEITEISTDEALTEIGLTTVQLIEEQLLTALVSDNVTVSENNVVTMDVKLLISSDGGETWEEATEETFPSDGVTVTLPYPEGTNSYNDFLIAHMFTTDTADHSVGDVEILTPTKTADGLQVTFSSLSPVAIAWYSESLPGDVDGDGEVTGFDASLILQYEVGLIDESGLDLSVADVDGDGEVTGFDASLILQYEVGLIDSF